MDKVLAKRLVVDKKVDVEETYQPIETVFVSGTNKSLYQYSADSYSLSSIIFNNITPPSLQTVVKRSLDVQIQMYVTTTWPVGTGGGQFQSVASAAITNYAGIVGNNIAAGQTVPMYEDATAVPPVLDNASVALRANPLAQALSTADVRINGTSTTVSFNDYAQIYQYVNDHDNTMLWSSEFPLQRDNSPVFENKSARSPFAKFNSNPYEPSRASVPVCSLVQSATAAGVVTNVYLIQWTEQLPISPFLTGKDQENTGLSNINNITLNLRIDNLTNALCAVGGYAGVTYVPNFSATVGGNTVRSGQPILLMEYITQNSILASHQPPVLVYDYQQIQPFLSPGGVNAGNGSSTVPATISNSISGTSTSLRLVAIPSLIYLYAQPKKGLYDPTIPNMYLNIQQVKILFNNRVNLLVDYTSAQLYQISVKNGLKQSWSEWNNGIGSLMIINVAEDLGLQESEQAGQGNSYCTLQAIVTFSNQNLVAAGYAGGVPFDFYLTTVTPGKAYISKSECDFTISSAPQPAEVLAITADSPKLLHEDLPHAEGQDGGSFSRLLKRGLSAVRSGLSMIKPEHLEAASSALGMLGAGVSGAGMSGAGMRHRRGK